MRPSLYAFVFALLFCGASVHPLFAQDPAETIRTVQEPAPAGQAPAEKLIPLNEELPQVTVVRRGEETVTEFRLRGKLYMVKVTLQNGMSYYLIDYEGKGQWVRDSNAPRLSVPMWVLTSW
jgi:hypothetical protein